VPLAGRWMPPVRPGRGRVRWFRLARLLGGSALVTGDRNSDDRADPAAIEPIGLDDDHGSVKPGF
jgi:hypothetical protein